jgi:hypothetical protein
MVAVHAVHALAEASMFGCKSAPSHNFSIRAPFIVARCVISGGYHRGSFESVIKAIVAPDKAPDSTSHNA